MNAPYAKYLLQAEGHLYPYSNETQFRIAVVENTKKGFPPDAIYRLEPDLYGYRYNEIDVDELLNPSVELPVQIVEKMIA